MQGADRLSEAAVSFTLDRWFVNDLHLVLTMYAQLA